MISCTPASSRKADISEAQPDGVLELYQAGSEGPQWWQPYPDRARNLPTRSIQDRCMATKTCPKIIEHFGAAEIWALKLGPEWVGTDAKEDIPLPANVRRYYIGSSTHGGGSGGFNASLAEHHKAAKPVQCPGNNWGNAVLPANPLSHDEPWRAITVHFRDWVMKNTAPPPSYYPTIKAGQLVRVRGDRDNKYVVMADPDFSTRRENGRARGKVVVVDLLGPQGPVQVPLRYLIPVYA